jgi:hypothetical protein
MYTVYIRKQPIFQFLFMFSTYIITLILIFINELKTKTGKIRIIMKLPFLNFYSTFFNIQILTFVLNFIVI